MEKNKKEKNKIIKFLTDDHKIDDYLFVICGVAIIVIGVLGQLDIIKLKKSGSYWPIIFIVIGVLCLLYSVFELFHSKKNKREMNNSVVGSLLIDENINKLLDDAGINSSKAKVNKISDNRHPTVTIKYSFDENIYLELEISARRYYISANQDDDTISNFDSEKYGNTFNENDKTILDVEEDNRIDNKTIQNILAEYKVLIDENQIYADEFTNEFYK